MVKKVKWSFDSKSEVIVQVSILVNSEIERLEWEFLHKTD